MKLRYILPLLALAGAANADSGYQCKYRFNDAGTPTQMEFELPESIRFGLLVPITLKRESGQPSKMNTVILKDHPYLVLADVYRVETPKSRIFLMQLSPDRSSIDLAIVNMGAGANAVFGNGNCVSRKETK